MKRNIVESYSIEEAFKALNKKPQRKVVESAESYDDYSFVIGTEFAGGHGGDGYDYDDFKLTADGWTFRGNDGDPFTTYGPYKTLGECVVNILKENFLDTWDSDYMADEIDDEEVYVILSGSLANALSEAEMQQIKSMVTEFEKFPTVSKTSVVIDD